MFGSRRTLLVGHIDLLLAFRVIWEVVDPEAFPCFLQKPSSTLLWSWHRFFFCIFEGCSLSEVFEFCHFFTFFLINFCQHSFSCIFFPMCTFGPTFRLSEFRLFKFSICFVFSLKRATSSASLKFVRSPASTLIPLEMSAFLKTSSNSNTWTWISLSDSSVYREFISRQFIQMDPCCSLAVDVL